MATVQSWRKAYGALKDRTTVGLAHVNSDFKDLDVAVVKTTNHVECPPKERHLRKILVATSAVRPRADVAYCIHALSRRLAKTRNWTGVHVNEQNASAIEESNALALAIVPAGTTPFNSEATHAKDFSVTGWELALVNTTSTNLSSVQERKLAGGLDSLFLDSLYNEGAYRASQQIRYGVPTPNPFEVSDPIAMSNDVPSPSVHMAGTTQPQNPLFSPFQPANPQIQQQHNYMTSPQNPFGNTTGFGTFPVTTAAHPQSTNPFGNAGLL